MWLFMMVVCWILQSADTEELKSKRHLNPQEFMNIDEIINYWGYPSEQYQVLTADGYYLQANRIPYGVNSPRKTGHRPVVLLVHGLIVEGRCWIANLPNNSLAFVLADAGYDVWIINCRGTTWSRRHLFLSVKQDRFWDFSFHEMGIFDVPATINFILEKTKQDGLYYVAHSQGASIGFIAFSLLPELAQRIKLFISLSPGYSLVGTKGLLKLPLTLPRDTQIAIWGNKEFRLVTDHVKDINAKICSYEQLDQLCIQVLCTAVGFNEHNLNVSRADVYAGIFPDYTSAKTGLHWSQVYRSKQFKYYNYGSKNKEVYNSTTPPFYKIEDMLVPTAVWYGGKDFLVTKEDIELLLPRIPRLVFQKYIPSWDHADSILGLDAPERLYRDLFFLMQQFR